MTILEIDICGIKMKNPTMLAAGILGSTAASLNWAARRGAGAVVTKSFGLNPNKGYGNPTTVEVTGGVINAIGLSNPGVNNFKDELEKLNKSVPVIASLYGANREEFSEIAERVEGLVDALELNVSCPHAMGGCGSAIGQDPDLTAEIVISVKKSVKIPVFVKLYISGNYIFAGIWNNYSVSTIWRRSLSEIIDVKNISSTVPDKYSLSQNYPNPFNPSTKIRFSIPPPDKSGSRTKSDFEGGQGGMIVLKVYDILGNEIATLVNEYLKPGTYEVKFDGSQLVSGMYFYTLTAGDFKETKKLILIK